jgi:hypothetical protein
MTTLDFNSDQFLQLLTDALRAGPGSPAWHDAVARLRTLGADSTHTADRVDEYKLLMAAREHLESGKGYREIRAGPLFTRKVMAAVEGEDQNARAAAGLPTPAIIAVIGGLVALAVIGLVTFLVLTSGRSQAQALADLAAQTFPHDVLTAQFGSGVPSGWRQIGSLKGTFEHDFRPPALAPGGNMSAPFDGCGIVSTMALPLDKPAQVEVTFRLPPAAQQVIPQVFVTDQIDFTAERGTSSHELQLSLPPGADQRRSAYKPHVVLPDGTFPAGGIGDSINGVRDTYLVRIAISGDYAIVECDGKRLYAGPHQLAADKPRYVGVRFLRKGNVNPLDLPAVVNVRVSKG